MTARNDITGDAIKTKGSNDAYRDGWARRCGPKRKTIAEEPEPTEEIVYHLRSYGDVTKEQLDAYLARHLPAGTDDQR